MLVSIGLVDAFFLMIMTMSVILGAMRGMFRQVMSWVSWFAVFFLGYTYAEKLANWALLEHYIDNFLARYILVLVGIFIAVFIFTMLLNFLIRHVLSALELTGMDTVLGVCFGLCQGLLLFLVVVIVVKDTTLKETAWWKSSYAVKTSTDYILPKTQGLFSLVDGVYKRIDAVLLPILLLESTEVSAEDVREVATQPDAAT